MADIIKTQGESVPSSMRSKWKDMGDGTHALQRSVVVDGTVDVNIESIASGDVDVDTGWRAQVLRDMTHNDNSKDFQVPAGQEYEVLWVRVEMTSDGGTAGTRQTVVEALDANGVVVYAVRAGTTQDGGAARVYSFAAAHADLLGFRDTDFLMTPLAAGLVLPAGYILRVRDNKNRCALDDMMVFVGVAYRTVP